MKISVCIAFYCLNLFDRLGCLISGVLSVCSARTEYFFYVHIIYVVYMLFVSCGPARLYESSMQTTRRPSKHVSVKLQEPDTASDAMQIDQLHGTMCLFVV